MQLVDLVARILALVPPWVRIYRIQRDIPMPLVTSGVEKGAVTQLACAPRTACCQPGTTRSNLQWGSYSKAQHAQRSCGGLQSKHEVSRGVTMRNVQGV